jgi:methylthioribose-1-phosphate isomerase
MSKEPRWRDVASPVFWDEECEHPVTMLDQRLLPTREIWRRYRGDADVAEAIREMVVRGAPAIGCAAAFGLAAASRAYPDEPAAFRQAFDRGVEVLAASRPTAVNLFWALEKQKAVCGGALAQGADAARRALLTQAQTIWREDIEACKAMGRNGAELIPAGARVLTHCNAGALATGGLRHGARCDPSGA